MMDFSGTKKVTGGACRSRQKSILCRDNGAVIALRSTDRRRGRNGPFIVRGYRSPSTLAIKMIGPAIIKSPRQLVPVHDAFRPMNQSESRFDRTGTFSYARQSYLCSHIKKIFHKYLKTWKT